MANERRLHYNWQSGWITNNPLAIGGTTMTSAELANFPVVDSTSYAAITLDPGGVGGAPEIVWITAHTASSTSATIVRQREGSTARQHNVNTRWSHSATALDLDYPKSYATRLYMRANFR